MFSGAIMIKNNNIEQKTKAMKDSHDKFSALNTPG